MNFHEASFLILTLQLLLLEASSRGDWEMVESLLEDEDVESVDLDYCKVCHYIYSHVDKKTMDSLVYLVM